MPQDSTANAYLRTQVLTATPEKLRLMLLEGAVRFARKGREGLAARDFATSFEGFSRCRDILIELMNSMRPDVDPDLCSRVHGLYVFIYQTIVEAGLEKDVAKADKAIELLEFERETWSLAIQKLASERGAGSPTPAATGAPAAAAPRPVLSLQG